MFSSERGPNVALHPGRDTRRDGSFHTFRPVALPALAAAVQIATSAAKTASERQARQRRFFVHEDDPQD